MRLFVAVDFNGLKGYFSELQSYLPQNVKLMCTKSFHLTLKFLGEVHPDNVNPIINRLKSIKFQSFTVFLHSIGVFPTENYIRVVWVGLEPEDKVSELQKQIDEALIAMFKKEKGSKAHITLARAKSIEDKKQFLNQLKGIKIENKKAEIKDFRLIKSTLTPQGPAYDDLEIFEAIDC
ncbi:RNA 2',3'-cyclic phosphodiesterase [Candidatus Woesearchaeota archaeon]|nr:RNA 2',3'-cyclic phosphodiesterase [Candidatus Woesearchaeota archaeon]